MSQNHISIIDAPCGSEKTTAMIDGFMPEKKYLVVVPYLSEADRIISSSKLVPFQQPLDEAAHNTKSESIEALLLEGANIVTTHNLYSSIVYMVRQGLLDDYHIIIDEVPDVCEQVSVIRTPALLMSSISKMDISRLMEMASSPQPRNGMTCIKK